MYEPELVVVQRRLKISAPAVSRAGNLRRVWLSVGMIVWVSVFSQHDPCLMLFNIPTLMGVGRERGREAAAP